MSKNFKRRKKQPDFSKPWMECEDGQYYAFVVCKHVEDDGEPVVYTCNPDTLTGAGSISCWRGGSAHSVDECRLVCGGCALKRGWIKPEHLIVREVDRGEA